MATMCPGWVRLGRLDPWGVRVGLPALLAVHLDLAEDAALTPWTRIGFHIRAVQCHRLILVFPLKERCCFLTFTVTCQLLSALTHPSLGFFQLLPSLQLLEQHVYFQSTYMVFLWKSRTVFSLNPRSSWWSEFCFLSTQIGPMILTGREVWKQGAQQFIEKSLSLTMLGYKGSFCNFRKFRIETELSRSQL